MSAEVLLKAAALMRERATGAMAESGQQWSRRVQVGGYAWLEPAHIGLHGAQSTADHIAGMDPAVALLVSIWLEREGRRAQVNFGDPIDDAALAVARAYLATP